MRVRETLDKGVEVQRLLGSLAVDSGRTRRELGWRPPFTLDRGLAETVRWYRGVSCKLQGTRVTPLDKGGARRAGDLIGSPRPCGPRG